jgi:hypothetical protein
MRRAVDQSEVAIGRKADIGQAAGKKPITAWPGCPDPTGRHLARRRADPQA